MSDELPQRQDRLQRRRAALGLLAAVLNEFLARGTQVARYSAAGSAQRGM